MAKGLTLKEVSKHLGITYTSLSLKENKGTFKQNEIVQLSKLYNLNVKEITAIVYNMTIQEFANWKMENE